MSIASRLPKALDELMMCCERLKECDKCNQDGCPMWANCLEETDFATIAYERDKKDWEEFIEAAENAVPEYTQEEWDADHADVARNDPDDF